MACAHENFRCDAGIQRIAAKPDGVVSYYSAEIRVHCVDCGQKFEFVGLPLGCSPYRPTVSMDGLILSAPMMPEGQITPPGLPSLSCCVHETEN